MKQNVNSPAHAVNRPRLSMKRELPALDWISDAAGRCARVTAIGSHQVLIENLTAILELSDDLIRVDTGCGPLCVCGSALSLGEARTGSILVRGNIHRVELPCKGGCSADEM